MTNERTGIDPHPLASSGLGPFAATETWGAAERGRLQGRACETFPAHIPGHGQMDCIKLPTLSVRQPWAWLLSRGWKDIENRTFRCSNRGPMLIHASLGGSDAQKVDTWLQAAKVRDACRKANPEIYERLRLPMVEEMEHGGIVGIVRVHGCVTEWRGPWFFGPFGWTVDQAQPLPFLPLKDQLGIFMSAYPAPWLTTIPPEVNSNA